MRLYCYFFLPPPLSPLSPQQCESHLDGVDSTDEGPVKIPESNDLCLYLLVLGILSLTYDYHLHVLTSSPVNS